MVDLFEIQDGKVIPSVICYSSKTLKEVMKVFKKDKNYLKVYTALFYLTCPDKKRNPYWDLPENEKEEVVLKEAEINFSLDEKSYVDALAFCEKLYNTPTKRFFLDVKIGMEKQGAYLREAKITPGRDGSDTAYLGMLKSAGTIADQFLKVQKITDEEVGAAIRGGHAISYDEEN